MFFPLNIEAFGSVLSKMNDREAVANETIVWTIVVLAALLILSVLGRRLIKGMRRRDVIARGFARLQRVSDRKGLNPILQGTLERLVIASPDRNPASIVGSVQGFDQAVSRRMKAIRRLPWLEMEQEVERLVSIRTKLGYRYIAEDRRPQNTRHLMVGQRIYILAGGPDHFRLLSAEIIGLNDLAITTDLFQEGDQTVRLRVKKKLWAFFWSPAGGECRFSTKLIKAYETPNPYLMFEHADKLVYNQDRKIFSCDLDIAVSVERVAAETYGSKGPSDEVFDSCEVDGISAQLTELSASGFVILPGEAFKVDDLVRLTVDDPDLKFLNGTAAKVVTQDGPTARCRFLKKTRESLETILTYVTPRISKDALKGRSRKRAVTTTPS